MKVYVRVFPLLVGAVVALLGSEVSARAQAESASPSSAVAGVNSSDVTALATAVGAAVTQAVKDGGEGVASTTYSVIQEAISKNPSAYKQVLNEALTAAAAAKNNDLVSALATAIAQGAYAAAPDREDDISMEGVKIAGNIPDISAEKSATIAGAFVKGLIQLAQGDLNSLVAAALRGANQSEPSRRAAVVRAVSIYAIQAAAIAAAARGQSPEAVLAFANEVAEAVQQAADELGIGNLVSRITSPQNVERLVNRAPRGLPLALLSGIRNPLDFGSLFGGPGTGAGGVVTGGSGAGGGGGGGGGSNNNNNNNTNPPGSGR